MRCDPPHPINSGIHRQKKPKGSGEARAQPNSKAHDIATPRVKSAAKSRKAVALLNSIVDAKDDLLKEAIVSMDHKARNHLISKNNDFVKFVSVPSYSTLLSLQASISPCTTVCTFSDHDLCTKLRQYMYYQLSM